MNSAEMAISIFILFRVYRLMRAIQVIWDDVILAPNSEWQRSKQVQLRLLFPYIRLLLLLLLHRRKNF